jgi:NAD dependent epimerase/dehydratase family
MHLETRVLVTGRAGFLGSHLCERLLADGAVVLCVDNFFTGARRNIEHLIGNPHFELIRHDVIFPLYVEVDLHVLLRRFTISTTQCKQRKRACTAQSICWVLQNACGQEFSRHPHRKSMAIRAFILRPRSIGVTSIQLARAPATMKANAAQRPCF